uniref:Uncharacterized protein n=1 Tax=Anopheles atroparvus TaxID=41427 RepID=A0A182J4D4_ANOAO
MWQKRAFFCVPSPDGCGAVLRTVRGCAGSDPLEVATTSNGASPSSRSSTGSSRRLDFRIAVVPAVRSVVVGVAFTALAFFGRADVMCSGSGCGFNSIAPPVDRSSRFASVGIITSSSLTSVDAPVRLDPSDLTSRTK